MNERVQDLSLFSVPVDFRGRSAWFVQMWWLVQGSLFRYSPQFLYGWRRLLLRCFGADIGKKVLVRPTAIITYPWKVKIGDYSWIGDDVILYSLGEIEIGAHAVISQRSHLCTGSHDFKDVPFTIFASKITVHDEAWVASEVFIAPGITVGRGAVVGARSSVFNDLPAMSICVGSPAKPINSRNPKCAS